MDFRKSRPSKNFEDRTGIQNFLQSILFDPYSPEAAQSMELDPSVTHTWSPNERIRIEKGENPNNLLRDRMRNTFLYNWLFGPGAKHRQSDFSNFNFHKEDFDTHSNLRKRSRGKAYDNY